MKTINLLFEELYKNINIYNNMIYFNGLRNIDKDIIYMTNENINISRYILAY